MAGDIDAATEVELLQGIPPAALYRPDGTRVDVHVLYAARAPIGELEEADLSDEEDLYDWYTAPAHLHLHLTLD